MNHIKHIDALRLIAVCLVLCHHWILIQPLKYLPFGSTISFVISSFLIGRILLNMRSRNNNTITPVKPLILFYLRRAIRIFPAYYLLIAICWTLDYGKTREVLSYLITFTTNFYIVNFGITLELLGHLWSVAVQEQYYIVIPILLLLIPVRYIKLVSFITIVVGLFYRLHVYYYDLSFWHLHVSTLSCLDTFGVGTYIAYLSVYEIDRFKQIIENKTLLTTSIIILLLAAMFGTFFQKNSYYYLDFYRVVERTIVSIGTMWLVGYAYFDKYNKNINSLFQSKVILYLGKISYGIYLYHFFVAQICSIVLSRMNLQMYDRIRYLLPAYFIITFILAALSWELFEKPINKLKTKLY